MSEADFAALTEGLCLRFWGEPISKAKTEYRWGSGGSRSFSVTKRTWFDHEAHEGGGAVELVMREQAVDKAGALAWLETEGLIDKRDGSRSEPAGRRSGGERPDDTPEPKPSPPNTATAVEKAVKGYRYTDGDGNTLYEVIRYEYRYPDGTLQLGKSGSPRKTFKQRRPDGRGGYIWNLDGIGHTISRRPEVEIAIAAGRTIFLPEGEKDVETIEGWGEVGSTNSGGAANWKPEFAEFFRGADVVILGDDDEPGGKRVDIIARDLRGVARRVRVIYSWGGPKDVTDWKEAGGTLEQFQAMVEASPEWKPRPPVSKLGALGLHELHQPHLKHEFLVDGFLDRRGVAMMPGASASGKTFLVLEIGMCVAIGQPFWGMDTKAGLVVYQAGEGKEGITKRLDGWMLDRGIEPSASIPFKVLPHKINLFVDDKDMDELIAECRAWTEYFEQPMRMLVIDTFNKAITGANENAGQDMTRVLSRLERISEALDCVVLVPMHKGKDGQQRGHTSLTGDVANVLNVTQLGSKESPLRDSNGRAIRTVVLDKNKDGEGGRPMRFVLRQVVLGMDEKDRPITTCVVDKPNGDETQLVSEGKLSVPQTIYLRALRDAIDINGIAPSADVKGVPAGMNVVLYADFVARLRNKWPFIAPEHEVEKRNAEFQRAVGDAGRRLHAYGYVDRDNATKTIWWTGKTDRPIPKPKPAEPEKPKLPADVRRELDEMSSMEVPF